MSEFSIPQNTPCLAWNGAVVYVGERSVRIYRPDAVFSTSLPRHGWSMPPELAPVYAALISVEFWGAAAADLQRAAFLVDGEFDSPRYLPHTDPYWLLRDIEWETEEVTVSECGLPAAAVFHVDICRDHSAGGVAISQADALAQLEDRWGFPARSFSAELRYLTFTAE